MSGGMTPALRAELAKLHDQHAGNPLHKALAQGGGAAHLVTAHVGQIGEGVGVLIAGVLVIAAVVLLLRKVLTLALARGDGGDPYAE